MLLLELGLNFSILVVFVTTFFFVSLTPGMCMTLAMSLGMSIGLRRTFYMMFGELVGVGIVALSSVIGVATIMLQYPNVFMIFKYIGGAYLVYLGIQLWMSRGKMSMSACQNTKSFTMTNKALVMQGFFTAIANPKGWAFFIALLPPFIDNSQPLFFQIFVLITIILILEFICLNIYATGGSSLRKFLQSRDNVKLLNKVAGTLMLGVGIWLAFG